MVQCCQKEVCFCILNGILHMSMFGIAVNDIFQTTLAVC